LFTRLKVNGCEVPESLQCMILLAGIPPSWTSIHTHYLQSGTPSGLKFTSIRDSIAAEFDRQRGGPAHAKKISSVKRKGPDPSHRQEPYNDNKKKNFRRGKKGQNKGKEQQKKPD
ncbi:hypothetical protein FPV67DRAFT_1362252, partial [Lyophyllum atratum]